MADVLLLQRVLEGRGSPQEAERRATPSAGRADPTGPEEVCGQREVARKELETSQTRRNRGPRVSSWGLSLLEEIRNGTEGRAGLENSGSTVKPLLSFR